MPRVHKRAKQARRARQTKRRRLSSPSKTSLSDLPNELLLMIARHLRKQADINSLANTDHRLHSLLQPVLYRCNATHYRRSALAFGAFFGYTSVVQKSLEADSTKLSKRIWSPLTCLDYKHSVLCIAIRRCNQEVVGLLLRKGVNTEFACCHPTTALITAAQYDLRGIMRLLLEGGANVHARDIEDETRLYHAAVNSSRSSIQLLLGYGAQPNHENEEGRTPLSEAEIKGDLASCKMLLMPAQSSTFQKILQASMQP